MSPLPFNFVRLGTLLPAVLWRLLALPAVSAFVTVEWLAPRKPNPPYSSSVVELAHLLAIPLERAAEFTVVLPFFGYALLGYTLGWLANCVVLVSSRRYSPNAALRIVLKSAVPPSWERSDAHERLAASVAKDAEEWRAMQAMGPFRYIVVKGSLVFGTVCFLGINVVLPLVTSKPIAPAVLPVWFAAWVLFGLVLSGSTWLAFKLTHRSTA